MSIKCGHCGGQHESVKEVRECSTVNFDHSIEAPALMPDSMDEERSLGDPWEGAIETAPGVWSPGPAAYLEARRNPPRDPVAPPPAAPTSQFAAPEVVTEGFYALEDDIYKVIPSRTGGRFYAMRLEPNGKFQYAKGAIYNITPEMRLTLDSAKAFGHKTGRCGCCGRELTNPDSIAAGIGPICAERYF